MFTGDGDRVFTAVTCTSSCYLCLQLSLVFTADVGSAFTAVFLCLQMKVPMCLQLSLVFTHDSGSVNW